MERPSKTNRLAHKTSHQNSQRKPQRYIIPNYKRKQIIRPPKQPLVQSPDPTYPLTAMIVSRPPYEIIEKVISFDPILELSFMQTCKHYKNSIPTILNVISELDFSTTYNYMIKYLDKNPNFIYRLLNLCNHSLEIISVLRCVSSYYSYLYGKDVNISIEQCEKMLKLDYMLPDYILPYARPEVVNCIDIRWCNYTESQIDSIRSRIKYSGRSASYLQYYSAIYKKRYELIDHLNKQLDDNSLSNEEIVLLYILSLEYYDINIINKLYSAFPILRNFWPTIPTIDRNILVNGKLLYLHTMIDTNRLFNHFINDAKFINFLLRRSQYYIEHYTNKPMFRLEKMKLNITNYDKDELENIFKNFFDNEYYYDYKFDYNELCNIAKSESRDDLIECLISCKDQYGPVFG